MIKPQLQFRPAIIRVRGPRNADVPADARRVPTRGRLWLAIPLLALWSNLHGGFFIGIAALGTYTAVSGLQDVMAGRGYSRAIRLAAISVAAALATLATPYGFGTWTTVVHALHNPYTRIVIVEWQPLASAALEHWQQHRFLISNYDIGIAMMAATGISWALTIEATDLPLFAIAAVMAIAAFISNRNLPIAMIALGGAARAAFPAGVAIDSVREDAPRRPQRSGWINQTILHRIGDRIFVRGGFFSRSLESPDPYPAGACRVHEAARAAGQYPEHLRMGRVSDLEHGAGVAAVYRRAV